MRAKKSLGQHFLTSTSALTKIIEAAELKAHDIVLEIGPGEGVLTQKILENPDITVFACEKDDRAIPILQEKFKSYIDSKRFILIHGDILELDMAKYGLDQKDYKIIANIPYYITGEILEKFLEKVAHPSLMVLMVQKEVALRIMARDNKESILSLSIKLFGVPSLIAHVPRGAFNPPPTVDSAILKIAMISRSFFLEHNIAATNAFNVIKNGFAHKRKLLIRNLEAIFDKKTLEDAWKTCELDQNVRAEDLNLEKWKSLIRVLNK